MDAQMKFKRHHLPVGDDEIPVLVASENEQPKAVFMSYDAFLELAATLYTAIEALRAAGINPDEVLGEEEEPSSEPEPPTEEDYAEFASWDADRDGVPYLRLVV